MARKKGFFINKLSLESKILEHSKIVSIKIMNHTNQQTRYTLQKNETLFYIDVYFRADKTITINPIDNGGDLQLSHEIFGLIRDSDEYRDATYGTFSTELSYKNFKELTDFLLKLPSVSQILNKDNGNNGIITKYTTDFGDSITLTFYCSTSKMFYQGRLMKLYAIIKTFIGPLSRESTETTMNLEVSHMDTEFTVDQYINKNLPNGYSLLNPIMSGFVRDTFTLVVASPKLNDYAAWVMAIMRVLEHRIKDICSKEGYIIDDQKGFSYFTDQGKTKPLFYNRTNGIVVNNNISSRLGTETCEMLCKCYSYLKENRHEIFHATQIAEGTKLVSTAEDAIMIITGACELIEESLVYNKK